MPETSNQNNNQIDSRELVKIFNDRFDKMEQNYQEMKKDSDAQFAKIDDRFDKVDQTYCELVEFLSGQFDKMNAKIDTKADKADTATKEDINLALNRMAMINAKTDDYRAEQINMQRQVDKHEKWHFQVAEKAGVKLSSD